MMRRIRRGWLALWHRRELKWVMAELGLANLDELDAFLETPLSEAEARFLQTRDRILARRNPARLVEDALWCERLWRAVGPVVGRRAMTR
jgi:hypothetical protein